MTKSSVSVEACPKWICLCDRINRKSADQSNRDSIQKVRHTFVGVVVGVRVGKVVGILVGARVGARVGA